MIVEGKDCKCSEKRLAIQSKGESNLLEVSLEMRSPPFLFSSKSNLEGRSLDCSQLQWHWTFLDLPECENYLSEGFRRK